MRKWAQRKCTIAEDAQLKSLASMQTKGPISVIL